MASKRGLTVDEKRKRMLDFFFEKQDFFQLKDVEKLCSQEKGITINTIKDILTALVDDGLVQSEKIGTSVYYWSLPSKALASREENIVKLEASLADEKRRQVSLRAKLNVYVKENETGLDREQEDKERVKLQDEISEQELKKKRLLNELDALKENDPALYEQLREQIAVSKKACNRWIENIGSLKSWMKKKFNCDEKTIDKQFEIPADLDYID